MPLPTLGRVGGGPIGLGLVVAATVAVEAPDGSVTLLAFPPSLTAAQAVQVFSSGSPDLMAGQGVVVLQTFPPGVYDGSTVALEPEE